VEIILQLTALAGESGTDPQQYAAWAMRKRKFPMKKIVLLYCIIVIVLPGGLTEALAGDSPLKITSGYIDVDGGKLFYEMAGEGEWIVLLHDGTIHREIWDAQFPVLAKDYRVVRYDRRGYGKSPNPEAPYSNIDDLNRLFVQLQIDKAMIFGMSAGGGLCIDFTLKYPEKVTTMILVGAVVNGYSYSAHMLTRGGRLNSITDLFTDQEYFIRYIGWEDPYTIYPENVKAKERCLELLKANPINTTIEKYTMAKPADRLAAHFLSEIDVPTLVLVGEQDIPDVHAHSGVIEFGIPGAVRDIIPECGHLIPLDQPGLFNGAVFGFLGHLEFFTILETKGVDAAAEYFHKKRETDPGIVIFHEGEMNGIGYQYLQNGDIKAAIEMFKLNTIAYPNSANVYDSLGEAYLADGQKDLAVKNYKKSLELNPNNTNAQNVLKEID